MKRLLLFILLVSGTAAASYASSIEASVGMVNQVNITELPATYSWKLSFEALYRLSFPILLGAQFNFQDGYQEIILVPVIRLFSYSEFNIDINIGGGLAAIKESGFIFTLLNAGISIKYFLETSFFKVGVTYTDLIVVDQALQYINTGIYYGFFL
ncbi:MAG: hypothetical protein HPY53_11120 [Brevinematales bacterium]|nr:hypothetical protein [Brevinematales bacterium]